MHKRQLEKNLKIHQLEDEVDALRRKIEELQLNVEEKNARSEDDTTRIDLNYPPTMED